MVVSSNTTFHRERGGGGGGGEGSRGKNWCFIIAHTSSDVTGLIHHSLEYYIAKIHTINMRPLSWQNPDNWRKLVTKLCKKSYTTDD